MNLGTRIIEKLIFTNLKSINNMNPSSKSSSRADNSFFDKKFLVHVVLTVFTSASILYTIKTAGQNHLIHFSYFVAAVTAILLGVVEPSKGWVLAFMQAFFLLVGYHLICSPVDNAGRAEIENFGLYGSILLTFIVSLLGGFVRRAFGR